MNHEIERIQTLLSSVWPNWRITKRIGKGSYGSVYEIVRNDLGYSYKCALKVLEMEIDDQIMPEDITVQVLNTPSYISSSSSPYSPESASTGLEGSSYASERELSANHTTPSELKGIYKESKSDILEEFVLRVSNEISLMMQLKGTPNIVSIEDYIVLRGNNIRTILIRTELLQGIDQLSELHHGMKRSDVVRLGIDICSALIRCEDKNIIHRDIKPGNIFYSENGGYKLGDFGISRTMDSIHEKMSMSGVGTIQYMAPEVYFGSRYDHTVDIYSLGLTLYTLLNENLPPLYNTNSLMSDNGSTNSSLKREANMRRLRGEPLPAPKFADERLSTVILMACNPDPSKRFQTAVAFQNALKDCMQIQETVPSPESTPSVTGKDIPAPRLLLVGATVLLAIAATMFIILRPFEKKKSKEVTYSIIYQDTNGNLIGKQEHVGIIGETVAYSAQSIEGYSVKEKTKSVLLSENAAQNDLTFIYEKKSPESVESSNSGAGNSLVPPIVSHTIQWTDQNLAKAIKESLGSDKELTNEDAAKITELVLDSSDISDINDLQYFTGLHTLSLAGNSISDISPLAGLISLNKLNLENNHIQDLTPLQNLTNLQRLDLYNNNIADISPLASMTKLTMLDLRNNSIVDLSPCSGMLSLRELYLSFNKGIQDIQPLAGLTSLWYLSLKNTEVQDLTALSNFDKLTTLVLAHTKITNLDPIRDLPKLSYLDIRGCDLKDTSVLDQLKKKDDFKLEQ